MSIDRIKIHSPRIFASVCLSALLVVLASPVIAQQAAIPTPSPTPAPVTTPAPMKIGSIVLSGSLRIRAENWDWFETNQAENAYTFGAATLRVALSQQKESYEWLVEAQAPVLMGTPENAVAPAPQGQLGLGAAYFAASGRQDASLIFKQGFVRFKGLFGDKASSLKLGRFEFNDGQETTPADLQLAIVKRDHISQRLIGAFGFTHVGRSFDGAQYVRNFKSGNLTFLGARPTEGVFQLNGNDELAVDLWYTAFTKPEKYKTGESEWRAFALHYHDGRRTLKTDNRPQALRAADTDNIRTTTLGGHYIGVAKAGPGKVDVLFWGAAQFGEFGRLSHRAGAVAAEAGYGFAARWKPWIRGGYFRGSGDDDPNDGSYGTFFQILPTPRIYARTPFFNAMNNEDVFGQLRLKPHTKLGLRFDAHHLRLSSPRDLWYTGGGAFQKRSFGYAGRPVQGRRSLGWLFDASADVTVTSRTVLTFYLAGIRGGDVQSAIYPLGGAHPGGRFAYFELTQKF
jgi:hypothetical protein